MPEQRVSLDGRILRLTNADKVLYPDAGFTKAQVIDYYVGVADVLLPALAGRPVTLRRYPDGVHAPGFFEKNASRHAPRWLRTVRLPTPGSGRDSPTADFAFIEDRPSLVWAANLAGIELHVPQWRVTDGEEQGTPDLLVFDLDPGEGTSIVHCCRVAEWVRDVLATDGLAAWPKTSGAKGLQLYTPVTVTEAADAERYAKAVATRLAREHPELVVATIAKAARKGKVLIDWSQNNPAKTTVAAYSLRARPRPTVSTPVTWGEVAACGKPQDLLFTAAEVRERLDRHGDLLDSLHAEPRALPS